MTAALGDRATSAAPATAADPYLWLEDVDGQRSMDWVHRENARSLPVLENDRRFPALLQAALQVAQNRDRLPLGGIQHGYLYNFWQDEDHVRGIWRRATVASYAAGNPALADAARCGRARRGRARQLGVGGR